MTRVDEPLHQGVYAPHTFIHTDNGCIVTFRARPDTEVASVLLEEVSGWVSALRAVPAGASAVPAGVVAALDAAHDAIANWSELIHTRQTSARRRAGPAAGGPNPSGAA